MIYLLSCVLSYSLTYSSETVNDGHTETRYIDYLGVEGLDIFLTFRFYLM